MNKILFSCLLALIVTIQLYGKRQEKPNVLVIYTDDHRYTGVHALGNQAVETPNLDKLADNGIAFTNTFLMGAFTGATCVPSRAMLHTGRDLFKLKGTGFTIPEEHATMGEAFKKAGYFAQHIGKWHQDFKALARSFDDGEKVSGKPKYLTDQFRMPFSDWHPEGDYKPGDCYLLEYDDNGNVIRRPLTEKDKRGPTGTEATGPHVSEVLVDETVDFLESYDKNQPFFLYLAFSCPHDPRQAPREYHDMYPVEDIELPPSYMSQHPFDNGHIVLRDEELASWPRTEEVAKQHLADYYATISHLDAQIGRVIESLKVTGQYDNTIVLMAGDSGLGVGNHGLLGKQNIYDEDGIHVPFILSGGLIDEKDKGRREDAFCYIHDIFPTLCDLAGVDRPESVNGISLVPVIQREKENIRECTFHAYRQHQRAFRKGDFKLIEYVRAPVHDWKLGDFIAGSRVTQLFNTKEDPWETFNLADFPEHKEKVAEMRKEMRSKAMELGDYADGDRVEVDFWRYFE